MRYYHCPPLTSEKNWRVERVDNVFKVIHRGSPWRGQDSSPRHLSCPVSCEGPLGTSSKAFGMAPGTKHCEHSVKFQLWSQKSLGAANNIRFPSDYWGTWLDTQPDFSCDRFTLINALCIVLNTQRWCCVDEACWVPLQKAQLPLHCTHHLVLFFLWIVAHIWMGGTDLWDIHARHTISILYKICHSFGPLRSLDLAQHGRQHIPNTRCENRKQNIIQRYIFMTICIAVCLKIEPIMAIHSIDNHYKNIWFANSTI